MATSTTSTSTHPRSVNWIDADHSRLAIPSWLLSALIHGLFLVCLVILSQSKGCQPDYAGDRGESFRQVGVYLTEGETEDEPPPSDVPQTSEAVPAPADFADSPLLDAPPVELTLPTRTSEPVLGLGTPPQLSTGQLPSPSLSTQAMSGPPPSTGTALGGATSLFGITDAGKRFVYVLDRSGSMSDHGALRVAKAELMSSLERLDATQEFQVIFYSNVAIPLVPRNARTDLFRGIDTHRNEVRRQIDAVLPDGGTGHLQALEMALKFNPDVIFFLTDAADPALSRDELDGLKRRNNGSSRIHCIEFGEQPESISRRGPKNFLETLSEQSGGQYTYRDVTKFR